MGEQEETSRRELAVEKTIQRFAPFRNTAGITRIADVTGLDRVGIPVYSSIRPSARSVAVSMGKGVTPELAWTSALMESLELYLAERIDSSEFVCAAPGELARASIPYQLEGLVHCDPADLMNQNISWAQSVDLESGEGVLVPAACVSADFTQCDRPEFQSSTNGLASGTCVDDASVHALLEIIERDALSLWYQSPYSRRFAAGLDTNSVDCPVCMGIIKKFEQSNVLLRVIALQGAGGIPVFLVFGVDVEESAPDCVRWTSASGADFSRSRALLRALTELAQVRLTLILGSREDVPVDVYRDINTDQSVCQSLIALPRVQEFSSVPTVDVGRLSVSAELAFLVRGIRKALDGVSVEHRLLQLRLTRQELPVPCVKMFASGLENPADESGYRPGPRARQLAS